MIPFSQLLQAAQHALRDAKAFCKKPVKKKADKVKQAVAFHNALLFALLIQRPMRETNLIDLTLGWSLVENDDGSHELLIRAVEEKEKKPYRIPFPSKLEKHLKEYLTKWRPILNQKDSDIVFMTSRGGRLTPKLLNDRTSALGEKYLGLNRMNPHFFRKLVVSSYLDMYPNELDTVRGLLEHRKVETTLKSYIHIRTLHASRGAALFARETSPEFRKLGGMFQT